MTEPWEEHQINVLAELKRLNDCYNSLRGTVTEIRIEISTLKVKAGIWGIFGGAIPVIIGLGIWFLKQ